MIAVDLGVDTEAALAALSLEYGMQAYDTCQKSEDGLSIVSFR